jgi:F0F1-type ATP synthase membrane subunit b/b'
MDATLHALGKLLIESIPTIIFFIILAVYLKRTYFQPVARILEERRRQTEGVRELAQKAFEAAESKTAEFEQALQAARNQLYQENEARRKQWAEEQAAELAEIRKQSHEQLEVARQSINEEIQRAQAELDVQVDALAEQIVASVLRGRAA